MKHSSEGFAKALETWNQRFEQPEYIFGTEPNEYLTRKADLLAPGKRALLVGDGEGRNSVWCARQGLVVDAFDLSPVAVEKARKLAREAGVQVNYDVAGIDEWIWEPEAYDAVILIFLQFATPKMRENLFANCIRTLKRGGILILQGYTPKQLEFKTGGPPILEHLYTENLLRTAFSALEILECRLYEAEISEGSCHIGMSALVGMAARKPASLADQEADQQAMPSVELGK